MKVLIFSTAYLPFVGGAELAIKEITDRLGSPSPLFRGGIKGGALFRPRKKYTPGESGSFSSLSVGD